MFWCISLSCWITAWIFDIFQVSKDLPEKQREIEYLLNNLIQFEQQLSQLQLWLSPIKDQLELYNKVGQPGAFDIKVFFICYYLLYILQKIYSDYKL